MIVYIALGSNLGDRRQNIERALELLRRNKDITVEKVSSLIETTPQGGPAQGDYLNGAAKLHTTLSAGKLLQCLQDIEARLGRQRLMRFGSRTIDLDILLYGDRIIDQPNLKVPHPRMLERDFVMLPLREIEPLIDELRKNFTSVNRDRNDCYFQYRQGKKPDKSGRQE